MQPAGKPLERGTATPVMVGGWRGSWLRRVVQRSVALFGVIERTARRGHDGSAARSGCRGTPCTAPRPTCAVRPPTGHATWRSPRATGPPPGAGSASRAGSHRRRALCLGRDSAWVEPRGEVIETLTRRGAEERLTNGAIVSLIGAVDACARAGDARAAALPARGTRLSVDSYRVTLVADMVPGSRRQHGTVECPWACDPGGAGR